MENGTVAPMPNQIATPSNDMVKTLLEEGFLTTHQDPNRENQDVYPVATEALGEAINFIKSRYQEGVIPEIIPLIDEDENASPNFSPSMQEELRTTISEELKNGERRFYLIHRDGHTSALIKEKVGGQHYFTMIDSYNAHGVKDADHLPILRMIRENLPEARIQTNHDKMQNDYYNCRTFAILSLYELGLAFSNNQEFGSVFNYVAQGEFEKYFKEPTKNESRVRHMIKRFEYEALRIGTFGLPPALLQLTQSVSMIKALAGEEFKELDEKRGNDGQTYAQHLEMHIETTSSGKQLNRLVDFFYQEMIGHMYNIVQQRGKRRTIVLPTPVVNNLQEMD